MTKEEKQNLYRAETLIGKAIGCISLINTLEKDELLMKAEVHARLSTAKQLISYWVEGRASEVEFSKDGK